MLDVSCIVRNTGEVALGSNMFEVVNGDVVSIDWLELNRAEEMVIVSVVEGAVLRGNDDDNGFKVANGDVVEKTVLVSLFKAVMLAPLEDVVNCTEMLDVMSFSLLEVGDKLGCMVIVGNISEGVTKTFSKLLVTEPVIEASRVEDISMEADGLVDDNNTGVLLSNVIVVDTLKDVDGLATNVEVGTSVERISGMLVVCGTLVTMFVIGKKSGEEKSVV